MPKADAVCTTPAGALVTLAKELDKLEAEVAKREEALKSIKAQAAAVEKKLVDAMMTEGVRSFRTEFGGFRTEAVCYPGVKDKEALYAAVKKNKKWSFLVTETIHGGRLKSFIKELVVEGKKLPPGVEPFMATEIRRFK